MTTGCYISVVGMVSVLLLRVVGLLALMYDCFLLFKRLCISRLSHPIGSALFSGGRRDLKVSYARHFW